ncbi:hypothetical protein ACEPAH_3762 [Sanghuangporus vaninii]
MKLFSGLGQGHYLPTLRCVLIMKFPAYFSPSIPVAVKDIWIAHGGSVSAVLNEKQLSQWIFCNGIGDPWLARYSVRPVVVFHTNWILASAASGFPLPLAKYVPDERYAGFDSQNILSQRNQGSCHVGMFRGPSEINPGIDDPADCDYSLYTRLTPTAEGNNPRLRKKRPYEASPEHRTSPSYDARVIKKRKSRSGEVFQGPASELGTSDSEGTPQIQTGSGRLAVLPVSEQTYAAGSNELRSSAASIPFSLSVNISIPTPQQSVIKENSESESEFCAMVSADLPLLCENLVNKGQVRNDMGYFVESLCSVAGSPSQLSLENPIGTPDSSCAGHIKLVRDSDIGRTGDIWSSLIQENASNKAVVSSDNDNIPVISVSDALVALRRLNAKVLSDHNDDSDVTSFVKGRIHCGRKFGVDKDDRRKTI